MTRLPCRSLLIGQDSLVLEEDVAAALASWAAAASSSAGQAQSGGVRLQTLRLAGCRGVSNRSRAWDAAAQARSGVEIHVEDRWQEAL